MKRFWIVLMAVAVALTMALPVGAAPLCSVNPDHAKCITDGPTDPPPDEPTAGLTCQEADPPRSAAGNNIFDCSGDCDGFDLTLAPRWNTCIDVESVAGVWTINVVDWGDAYEIAVRVQDSVAPGDACWGGCAGGGIITPGDPVVPFTSPFTPASDIDACGIDFGDNDTPLTFHAEAHFRPPFKGDQPAKITVTLPGPES